MTEQNARKVANAVVAVAAVGAAYYIARTPPLRRLAWRLAVTSLTGIVPGWLAREVQAAWAESERRGPAV
jgi:hypothetical protein